MIRHGSTSNKMRISINNSTNRTIKVRSLPSGGIKSSRAGDKIRERSIHVATHTTGHLMAKSTTLTLEVRAIGRESLSRNSYAGRKRSCASACARTSKDVPALGSRIRTSSSTGNTVRTGTLASSRKKTKSLKRASTGILGKSGRSSSLTSGTL